MVRRILLVAVAAGVCGLPAPAAASYPCPQQLTGPQVRWVLIGGSISSNGTIGAGSCNLGANVVAVDRHAWSFCCTRVPEYAPSGIYFEKDSYRFAQAWHDGGAANSVCQPTVTWNSRDPENLWETMPYRVRSLNRNGSQFLDETLEYDCLVIGLRP